MKKILVVDDEIAIRETLEQILGYEGYHVMKAGSGPEALQMIAAGQPDLVLLDIKMPGMDGFEVQQKIKDQGLDVPVIVISGHGNIETAVEAVRKGAEAARRNMVKVPMVGTTIPHEVFGEWGAAKVFIKPAAPGTGVIASGPVRAVLELAGVRDALSKCLGSTNPINVVKACLLALSELRSAAEIARLRGKKVKDLFVRWRDEKAEVPADNSEEKSDREKLETPQDSPGSGAEEAAADSGQTG